MPSKSDLDAVCDWILEQLFPSASDESEKEKVSAFVRSLNNPAQPDYCRLMLCLGIDLKSGAVRPIDTKQLILAAMDNYQVFQKIPLRTSSIAPGLLQAMGTTIRQKHPESIFQSNFIAEVHDPYVQVVAASKLATNTDSLPKVKLAEDNRRAFLTMLNMAGKKGISRWKKKNSAIFVVHKDDFDREIKNGTHHILEVLGIQPNDKDVLDGHYVALIYDSEFNGTFYQPCTFHGDWGSFDTNSGDIRVGNAFFISHYNQDRYGRTFSSSGSGVSLRERVHAGFSETDKSYKFEFSLLEKLDKGKGSKTNAQFADLLLDEAYRRFCQAGAK